MLSDTRKFAVLLCDVRYGLAVPEHRNFTYAAEALHVSQPTLSQRIRQLEDTLRTQRLHRSGRNVQFMDAGAAWMRYAKSVLRDLDAGGRYTRWRTEGSADWR